MLAGLLLDTPTELLVVAAPTSEELVTAAPTTEELVAAAPATEELVVTAPAADELVVGLCPTADEDTAALELVITADDTVEAAIVLEGIVTPIELATEACAYALRRLPPPQYSY